MSNLFTISPAALSFSQAVVQGPISGLYPSASTKTFTLTNNSGSSVTITNYGFTQSTEGDAATIPSGILPDSDFSMVPTSSSFPVTISNGSDQEFTVTYSPLRRGSGFGDVRSAILMFYSGSKALINQQQTTNSAGEVINFGIPQLVSVGVGGQVQEEAYDWSTVHPIYWSAGKRPSGESGIQNKVQGLTPNFTLADLDSGRHYSPIMLLTGITSSMGSAGTYVSTGARGVQVLVFFPDIETSADLIIYANTTNGNIQVGSWTGLNYSNVDDLFIGNNEGIDLQGLQLAAQLTSITNPNSGQINVGVYVTE